MRELQNIIERALLTTAEERIPRRIWQQQLMMDEVDTDNLPADMPSNVSLKESVEEFEKNLLCSYMPYYENSRQFAEFLGVEKSTVNRKLKKYGIRITQD